MIATFYPAIAERQTSPCWKGTVNASYKTVSAKLDLYFVSV